VDGPFGQRPEYNVNRPEVHAVYREWRNITDQYSPPRLLLGETWVGELERLAAFYGADDELQLAFNFPFVFSGFTAADMTTVVAATLAVLPPGACPVWTASNHDVGRFPSRWCGGDAAKVRLALLILATLPGALVLYYGDEIGMTDAIVAPELARDKLGAWAGRDRGRTPMPWDNSPAGGFTAPGVRPWLPAQDAPGRNVAAQREDPGSVLAFCRELLRLRKTEFGSRLGEYHPLSAPAGVWRYSTGGLTVAANLTDSQIRLPSPSGELLLSTAADRDEAAGSRLPGQITLDPWQAVITS
jgi:alpha-glucosidase